MGQIGYFGKQKFIVSGKKIFTFHDFQISAAVRKQQFDRIGLKPLSENSGPDLRTTSFSIDVMKAFGLVPRSILDKWLQLAEAGTTDLLVIGNKLVSKNPFTLTQAQQTWATFDSKGNVISATMQLSFEEYAKK